MNACGTFFKGGVWRRLVSSRALSPYANKMNSLNRRTRGHSAYKCWHVLKEHCKITRSVLVKGTWSVTHKTKRPAAPFEETCRHVRQRYPCLQRDTPPMDHAWRKLKARIQFHMQETLLWQMCLHSSYGASENPLTCSAVAAVTPDRLRAMGSSPSRLVPFTLAPFSSKTLTTSC